MLTTIPENILSGWTTLVIDDEPDAIEVVQLLLEMYGAKVYTAKNGRDGVNAIRKYHPRFVVCDISMPDMSGWDLIGEIKNDRTTAEIPIVALTAHALTGDREKAMAMGFHNYLTKPLQPETFVNQLLALLAHDIPELAQVLDK